MKTYVHISYNTVSYLNDAWFCEHSNKNNVSGSKMFYFLYREFASTSNEYLVNHSISSLNKFCNSTQKNKKACRILFLYKHFPN